MIHLQTRLILEFCLGNLVNGRRFSVKDYFSLFLLLAQSYQLSPKDLDFKHKTTYYTNTSCRARSHTVFLGFGH